MIARPCNFCQTEYQAEQRYLNRGQGIYCSRECGGLAKAASTLPPKSNTVCAWCQAPIYRSAARLVKAQVHFCDTGCQNNAYRTRLIKTGPTGSKISKRCLTCHKTMYRNVSSCKECSLKSTIATWLAGDNSVTTGNGLTQEPKSFVKKYLIETRGDACEQCGFSEKAPDGRSIIQMDHIDGNCLNNLIENLRLLCPNHHAMTLNYGSLNNGSGRAWRRSLPK